MRVERVAQVVSNVTVPTVLSAVAFLALSIHDETSLLRGLVTTTICWVTGSILPAAYVLKLEREKRVSDKHVPIREQRTRPYLMAALCYAVGLALLVVIRAPFSVWGLMWCYATNTLLIALTNLRWKMSAHAMGAAGALAGLSYGFGAAMLPAYVLLPVVGWARLRLRAHTLAQVVAGACAGLLLTFGQLWLISKLLR